MTGPARFEGLFAMVVDGPNFVNDLFRFGTGKQFIVQELSLGSMLTFVQKQVRNYIGTWRTTGLDFYYSGDPEARFLSGDNKLTPEEMDRFLKRQKEETGVRVHEVALRKRARREKGVDVSVVTRLFEMKEVCETVVLVSSDTDYVPALETLSRIGRFAVTAGFQENYRIELKNASFMFIDLSELYSKETPSKPQTD
ncbi:MAG: NYN domain-containing protein [Thermoplasmata archaeon]